MSFTDSATIRTEAHTSAVSWEAIIAGAVASQHGASSLEDALRDTVGSLLNRKSGASKHKLQNKKPGMSRVFRNLLRMRYLPRTASLSPPIAF
jgi:hypothetical protein